MAKIIHPGAFKSMMTWTDAFTAMLESHAEAKNNHQIKREVNESVKELGMLAKSMPTENNRALAANQKAVQRQMHFDLERHNEMMARWRMTKQRLIAAGWDLSVDLKFDELVDGSFRVWQADEKTGETFSAEDAQALLLFLKFVLDNSTKFDPIEYTKNMLLEQGINEHNFDQFADRMAITNPWKSAI